MSLTPETLTRHELNGLPVRVADAASADHVGIAGRVVLETMGTVHVDCDAASLPHAFDADRRSGVKQVPKRDTTFEFALQTTGEGAATSPACTDEPAAVRKAAGSTSQLGSDTAGVRPGQSGPSSTSEASQPTGECEDVVYVTVDGTILLSRPATRTERAGDSTWH